MNKKITSLFVLLILIISSTACNNDNKKTDSPKTEYTLASEKTDVKDEYKNLDEWQGNWESFVTYCKDKDMDNAWESIADKVDINESKLKDTFLQICYITDDISYFEINKNRIKGLNSKKKEVFNNEYIVIDKFEKKSKNTVIEGEESYLLQSKTEAGRYNYICIMPICSLEEGDGKKMLRHFHFNFGESKDEATNRSKIPTMIEKTTTDSKRAETLLTFFLGTKD